MPKQMYTIRDWSGGMNNRKDPRDLPPNEFSVIENMYIDALGKIKTIGGLFAHSVKSTGTSSLSEYLVEVWPSKSRLDPSKKVWAVLVGDEGGFAPSNPKEVSGESFPSTNSFKLKCHALKSDNNVNPPWLVPSTKFL